MSPHLKNFSQKMSITDSFQHYLLVLFTIDEFLKQIVVKFYFLFNALSYFS